MPDATAGRPAAYKRPLNYLLGAVFVVAGVMHFVAPRPFADVVPPEFPRPMALVYLSGVAEILLGLGVVVPRTRRLSAWGLIGLLTAVFPANISMAVRDVEVQGVPYEPADWMLWARLPLQGVLVLWAWWYTRPDGE
ncbi:hypothetical protein DP107_06975 [Haloglomus irregulare]|jgi:uncharacterized membrane protein|uniref:DoxX family membrane protein n=1 Tax=Haloglomus irregulare TaxID=2234134 RepID=A0A554NBE9_9EURY|nr:DoxX family protein [Haloglomus irregulare]TSD14714.1 hypothetical protein DP107_06975 [Haloglomus irregulare]